MSDEFVRLSNYTLSIWRSGLVLTMYRCKRPLSNALSGNHEPNDDAVLRSFRHNADESDICIWQPS